MNELKAIANINEEIKSIVLTAENISLAATNAMLVARQAGINAIGFSVVAHELRIFSEKMASAMQGLSGLIYRQVEITANKRHRERSLELLIKTGAFSTRAASHITTSCVRSQATVDDMAKIIASLVRELRMTISRTGKQCTTGLVIARSAGIEAAHGGVMTPVLRQIAQNIEEVVSNIAVRVKQLEALLTEVRL